MGGLRGAVDTRDFVTVAKDGVVGNDGRCRRLGRRDVEDLCRAGDLGMLKTEDVEDGGTPGDYLVDTVARAKSLDDVETELYLQAIHFFSRTSVFHRERSSQVATSAALAVNAIIVVISCWTSLA